MLISWDGWKVLAGYYRKHMFTYMLCVGTICLHICCVVTNTGYYSNHMFTYMLCGFSNQKVKDVKMLEHNLTKGIQSPNLYRNRISILKWHGGWLAVAVLEMCQSVNVHINVYLSRTELPPCLLCFEKPRTGFKVTRHSESYKHTFWIRQWWSYTLVYYELCSVASMIFTTTMVS